MKLSNNFSLKEFACNDGTNVPVAYMHNALELARNLQVLRDYLGCPININSAYRTVKHNKKIGGSPKSQHLNCKASDIHTKHHTPRQIKDAIETLIMEGKMKQGGIGLYNNFVHYDIRGYKARW